MSPTVPVFPVWAAKGAIPFPVTDSTGRVCSPFSCPFLCFRQQRLLQGCCRDGSVPAAPSPPRPYNWSGGSEVCEPIGCLGCQYGFAGVRMRFNSTKRCQTCEWVHPGGRSGGFNPMMPLICFQRSWIRSTRPNIHFIHVKNLYLLLQDVVKKKKKKGAFYIFFPFYKLLFD